jgi:hypothetical protein
LGHIRVGAEVLTARRPALSRVQDHEASMQEAALLIALGHDPDAVRLAIAVE